MTIEIDPAKIEVRGEEPNLKIFYDGVVFREHVSSDSVFMNCPDLRREIVQGVVDAMSAHEKFRFPAATRPKPSQGTDILPE